MHLSKTQFFKKNSHLLCLILPQKMMLFELMIFYFPVSNASYFASPKQSFLVLVNYHKKLPIGQGLATSIKENKT
jgi:hypothetical protein